MPAPTAQDCRPERTSRAVEEPLVEDLDEAGLDRRDAPVFVQSFETANLRELDGVVDVPLVQLLS